jgi:hypothetical protein
VVNGVHQILTKVNLYLRLLVAYQSASLKYS